MGDSINARKQSINVINSANKNSWHVESYMWGGKKDNEKCRSNACFVFPSRKSRDALCGIGDWTVCDMWEA